MSRKVTQQAQTLRVLAFPIRVRVLRTLVRDGRTPHPGYVNGAVPKSIDVMLGTRLSAMRIEDGPNVVNHKLEKCPRCGQALVDEGTAYYCRYGCTRMFPKLGALVSDRMEYERKSGLRADSSMLERFGSTYQDGMMSAFKSERERERARRDARKYAEKKKKARRQRILA